MEILFRRMEANNIAVIILNTSNRWLGVALVWNPFRLSFFLFLFYAFAEQFISHLSSFFRLAALSAFSVLAAFPFSASPATLIPFRWLGEC